GYDDVTAIEPLAARVVVVLADGGVVAIQVGNVALVASRPSAILDQREPMTSRAPVKRPTGRADARDGLAQVHESSELASGPPAQPARHRGTTNTESVGQLAEILRVQRSSWSFG